MATVRYGNLVAAGEKVADSGEVAARIRSAIGDLRCTVQCSPAANHQRADGLIRMDLPGQIDSRPTIKEKSAPRESEGGTVHNVG